MVHDCDVEVIGVRCQCYCIKETPTDALIYYLIITLLTLYVTPACFSPQSVIFMEYKGNILAAWVNQMNHHMYNST